MSAVRGARALLVDDNELNLQVGTGLLEAAGLQVTVATHGQAALDALARPEARFDIVLMDVQMPVMDGRAATRRIRADPRWAHLPVLAMTANAMQGDRELCLAAGMNSHIAKPVEPLALFHQLLQWLPHRHAGLALPASSQESPATGLGKRGAPPAWMRIPTLDAAAGLRRVLHKAPAYEAALHRFVQGQADAVDRSRAALAQGQPDEAERILHTLKGAAGTIGAEPLAALAGQAEIAVASADSAAEPTALAPVALALDALVAALVAALSPAPPQPTPTAGPVALAAPTDGAVDWHAVRALLGRLEALLREDDSEAVDFFHDHRTALRNATGAEDAALDAAISSFMFAEALDLLRGVRQRVPALA